MRSTPWLAGLASPINVKNAPTEAVQSQDVFMNSAAMCMGMIRGFPL